MQVALEIDNLRSFLFKSLQQLGKLDFFMADRCLLLTFIVHLLVLLLHDLLLAQLLVDTLELLFLVGDQGCSLIKLSLQGFLLKFLLDDLSLKVINLDVLGQMLFFSLSECRVIVIFLTEFIDSALNLREDALLLNRSFKSSRILVHLLLVELPS